MGGVPKKTDELAQYVMTGIDPQFPQSMTPGDFIVAGLGFGSGSSRESAALGLKQAGVGAIIAQSFGRIFYRNCVNIGLLPLVCSEAGNIPNNVAIQVNFTTATIVLSDAKTLNFMSPQGIAADIVAANGLMAYLKKREWIW